MSSDPLSPKILAENTDINLKNVDLTNCDREPIHIPNLIQPHGVLLAISVDDYQILQVSINTSQMLGIESQELLNKPLAELLGEEQVEAIKNCLSEDFEHLNPLAIKLARQGTTVTFDGIVHQNGEIIILELELSQGSAKIDFFNFHKLVKTPVNKIQNTNTLDELCEAIAQEVKKITGFDRVMVYRFDEEGAGTVIAEVANLELEPFLGLRYPATDIPKQAKHLYSLNFLRLIPNATYEPVEITPQLNPRTNQPLDMSIQENETIRISPRKSFAKWQETVRLKSLPWKACEVEAALELRSSIISIILRKADELTQVNQELTRRNIELDAFAYIASHDLKEPLRGIYNYSSFLIEDYSNILDEAGMDKLNTLMRLTHRMEDLIDSLLHYSRLGRTELQLRPVNLNDLVLGVLDVFKVSKRDKQVEFNIPRPLPTVNCDRTQVNELFTNLISNGIKYNQNKEKIIEIGYLDAENPIVLEKMLTYPDNTPEKTIFYIRDNGIGIRDKHFESIFRIFKRLHGQNKYGGGTGAGLTIAKKIVERHGGEIWVKSVYKESSTFYFNL
jgi:light-regulated signal transduction histidine kinase (bacteriophytochrome)